MRRMLLAAAAVLPAVGAGGKHVAMRQPHECAVKNTVIGTVASASFAGGLAIFAERARNAGFPCTVVQAFDWFDELSHELLAPLPQPSPPLLPRKVWCNVSHQRASYGWRRSQLYRVRLWRVVVGLGLDLLALDLDWNVGKRNPVGFLHSLRAPKEASWYNAKVPSGSQTDAPSDVVALWDGTAGRYLNVGYFWIRSTPATIGLTQITENRAWSGWEQQVFNEELNFNESLASVRCCHTSCLKHWAKGIEHHLPQKTSRGKAEREKQEGQDRCTDDAPYAHPPPPQSREPWKATWSPDRDTERSRHSVFRRLGRCNNGNNVCLLGDSGLTIGTPECPSRRNASAGRLPPPPPK